MNRFQRATIAALVGFTGFTAVQVWLAVSDLRRPPDRAVLGGSAVAGPASSPLGTPVRSVRPASRSTRDASPKHRCYASWYGDELAGNRTANGERFDPRGFTTAHRTLPFGTRLRVSFDGRSVVVRVNDRGPAAWTGRCLDLAHAAFAALAPPSRGVIPVVFEEVR